MTAKVKATMSERTENVVFGLRIAEKLKLDNGSDHRAGTIDLNIEKHMQVRLRVHRIVIAFSAVRDDVANLSAYRRQSLGRYHRHSCPAGVWLVRETMTHGAMVSC